MKKEFLCEVSWEVCNMVGGIYTVLSTKAQTIQDMYGDHYVLIGPDLWEGKENPYFEESADVLSDWAKKAKLEGLQVRCGRWKVPGSPQVVLVKFDTYFATRDALYGRMWDAFGVDSLYAYGDYDESCMFAYAASLVIDSLYRQQKPNSLNFMAHYHEWTTGMGLLNTKLLAPQIATIFTTHATCIGRSIAGNHYPLYDYLEQYSGDEMAGKLNMQAKHSLEKHAALAADSFTTVSSITARECTFLIGRTPIVTPNGFEKKLIPSSKAEKQLRESSRKALLQLAGAMSGQKVSDDAFIVATSGRFEFKNKGYDLFLDSLRVLVDQDPNREVIAFFFVPGWAGEARPDVVEQYLSDLSEAHHLDAPFVTHQVFNYNEDPIIQKIQYLGFQNNPSDKVKVIYIPCYLNGDDGLFNIRYYDLLMGVDATVFASYYEPWGYTPHESLAFSIPTITTTLAGFGQWVKEQGMGESTDDPVRVVERTDANYSQVVDEIASDIHQLTHLSAKEIEKLRKKSKQLTQKSFWNKFIDAYQEAYHFALSQAKVRSEA